MIDKDQENSVEQEPVELQDDETEQVSGGLKKQIYHTGPKGGPQPIYRVSAPARSRAPRVLVPVVERSADAPISRVRSWPSPAIRTRSPGSAADACFP